MRWRDDARVVCSTADRAEAVRPAVTFPRLSRPALIAHFGLMPLVVALFVLVIAAGWRVLALHLPELSNFAPLMALTYCSAVYFRDKRLWLVPFAALMVSDLYLDYYYAATYGETWIWPSVVVRAACFAAALPIGRFVAQHKRWLNIFSGALAGSVIFYVATNTDAWIRDPFYMKNAAGWWQALTVGRPEFPPTLFFFRNTLISDLLFTGVFALAMEYASLRARQPSLLAKA
jgi:hypothetical protein